MVTCHESVAGKCWEFKSVVNISTSKDETIVGSKFKSGKSVKRPGAQLWIDTAWEILGEGSVFNVTIQRLSSEIGVSRNTFYYHFSDRNELYDRLIDHWFDLHDIRIAYEKAQLRSSTPDDILFSIFVNIVQMVDSGQSAAIRLWAHSNGELLERMNGEERERQRIFGDLFEELGLSKTEARNWANIYISLHAAEYIRFGNLPLKQRIKNARLLHDAILSQII